MRCAFALLRTLESYRPTVYVPPSRRAAVATITASTTPSVDSVASRFNNMSVAWGEESPRVNGNDDATPPLRAFNSKRRKRDIFNDSSVRASLFMTVKPFYRHQPRRTNTTVISRGRSSLNRTSKIVLFFHGAFAPICMLVSSTLAIPMLTVCIRLELQSR